MISFPNGDQKKILSHNLTLNIGTSSQWYVSGPRYDNSTFLKYLQNKQKPSVPESFSIAVLLYDRKSKAFKSCTANI